MTIRTRFATMALLSALMVVTTWMAPPAFAQEPAQPANNQNQSPAQSPTSEQPRTAQSAAPQQSPSQKQSGTTTKEQQNIQHEKDTGTSKDRILWTLPNFLTLEDAENIPPLTSGQKFKVVGRSLIDPSEFVLIGFVAGLGQASDSDPSYGQGAEGYGKRYATAYTDNAIENFMASAALPSLLHQDPRYYQLGHGGFLKRAGHAISRVVLTRSDSGQTQFNYSEVFGAGMAAAISTYSYHPAQDKNFGTVVSVWGTQIGWDVGTYMLKEFWPDLRRMHHKKSDDSQ
ncbi:MAG: hypothetical protein WCA15_19410 [Candidatus Acidiferrales bacterium]